MIYDHRTYTLVTRKLKPYLKLFEEFALPVMQENGMVLERYFVTQIGSLNEVVHIWRYESLAALEQICIRRDADPRWADYLERSEGMVLMQQNKIVEEASFSSASPGADAIIERRLFQIAPICGLRIIKHLDFLTPGSGFERRKPTHTNLEGPG